VGIADPGDVDAHRHLAVAERQDADVDEIRCGVVDHGGGLAGGALLEALGLVFVKLGPGRSSRLWKWRA
jgi:hypothetical protein